MSASDRSHRWKFWLTSSQVVILLTLIGSSLVFFYVYFQNFILTEPLSNLDAMVAGTFPKPYVYRILIPLLIKAITSFVSIEPIRLAAMIMYTSLLGFLISLRYLYRVFWKRSKMIDWISFVALAGLAIMFAGTKIYDLPGLFLFTLGLAWLARGKFFAYLALFPLAVLNKETAVLLSLVFAVNYIKLLNRKVFLSMALYQLLIFIAIRLALRNVFQNNPGSDVEFHWREFWQAITYYPQISLLFIFLFGIILFFMLRRFHERPLFLQKAAIAMLPAQLVLYLLVGFPFELRFFLEAYPIIILFLTQPLGRILRIRLDQQELFIE